MVAAECLAALAGFETDYGDEPRLMARAAGMLIAQGLKDLRSLAGGSK